MDQILRLAATNRKFVKRFQKVEAALLESGSSLDEATLEEMDHRWE